MATENTHKISLELAIEMTIRYRENKDLIVKPEFAGKNILSLSETFTKEELLNYFNKPEVHAIRIYYGMDEELKIHAILVGVDADNKDILPVAKQVNLKEDFEADIFEHAYRCPPVCPPPSELNP